MSKQCRRCRKEKQIDDFYVHPRMADGHLNICKECKKKDSQNDYNRKIFDFEWKIKERVRTRERNKRLGYSPKSKDKKATIDKYFDKYPEKSIAYSLSGSIVVPEGKEKHHWSYSVEHAKDVIFLTKQEHDKVHCYIEYFQPAKMYKTIFGEPLFTKERFVAFMDYVLSHSHDEIINKFYHNTR